MFLKKDKSFDLRLLSQLISLIFIFHLSVFQTNLKAQNTDSIITLPNVDILDSKISTPNNFVKTYEVSPFLMECDIMKTANKIPNISGIRRGGTSLDPLMRGFRNAQLLVVVSNGIRIEGGCPNRMDPVTSHIDAAEVESINTVYGPAMLLYGPAIGGVLQLKLKESQPMMLKKISSKISLGYESISKGMSGLAEVNGGNSKFFYRISGGYRNYGNYLTGDGSEVNSSYQKNYFNINGGIQLKKDKILRLSYIRSEGRDVLFAALPMDEKHDFTDIFNIRYNSKWGKVHLFESESGLYYVQVNHLMDNSNRKNYREVVPPLTGIMQASSSVNAQTAGGNFSIKTLVNGYQLILKSDAEFIWKDGTRKRVMIMDMGGLHSESVKYDNLWLDAFRSNIGIVASVKKEFLSKNNKQKHFVQAFLRGDYASRFSADTLVVIAPDQHTVFDSKATDNFRYSAALLYGFNHGHFDVQFGLTRAYRNPDMNELYIKRMSVGFDSYDYLGNPNLEPELNHQIDLGFKLSLCKNSQLSLNLFASQIHNYIGTVFLPPSIITPASMGSPGVKQFENMDKAYFYGAELAFNAEIKNLGFVLTSGYTYAYLESATHLLLTNGQVTGKEIILNDPIPEIPPISVFSSFYYKIPKFNLLPTIEFRYIHKQDVISVANNELASPEVFLANFLIKYNYKFLTLSAGVENIFNVNYYDHLNRRLVGSNQNILEPGRNFVVNLNIKL